MMQNASLIKRLAAMLYELLTLIALWLLCTFIYLMLVGTIDSDLKGLSLQFSLWMVTGAYFVVCWVTTGQTLATQAWKIKLVNAEKSVLNIQQAVMRYALATASIVVFGIGFLWALIDKDQLFLHDRLLKTRQIIMNGG